MNKLLSTILLTLPALLFGQGNLDLDVYNYIYIDSLGNNYSEKEHSEQGVKGSYNQLSIRTNGDISTFTFQLREDNDSRAESNTEEVYTYRVFENGNDGDTEFWVLLRNDGAKLIFDYHKIVGSYSLTIPADEKGERLFVYIFTKSN